MLLFTFCLSVVVPTQEGLVVTKNHTYAFQPKKKEKGKLIIWELDNTTLPQGKVEGYNGTCIHCVVVWYKLCGHWIYVSCICCNSIVIVYLP